MYYVTCPGEPLANPLGELSSRLADYHKALYYADIEIGENRTQQIQTLQRGLQVSASWLCSFKTKLIMHGIHCVEAKHLRHRIRCLS